MMYRVLATLVLVLFLTPASASATSTSTAAEGLTVTAEFALLHDGGASVVLVGEYSCGPYPDQVPSGGVIDMSVNQVVNGVEVVGGGYLFPQFCDGSQQWYAVELVAYNGRFTRANARWAASGYVLDDVGEGQTVSVPPTRIRIR